jgi:Pectate lyase superfamily protein
MTTDPTTSSVTQSADQTFAGSVFIHGPGPWIDVRAFGATGTGRTDNTTDDTSAIQAAINAVPGNGGTVFLPPGTYLVSAPLQLRKGLRLIGAGQQASVLRSNHTGDGLRMNSPLNASTPVNVLISDLGLTNTQGAANTGGALVDVGGTFWRIERVSVTGFDYGVILDQTELADVIASQFNQQTRACVWLVNGEDHLGAGSGVKAGFTNRISVQNCQLNPNPTGTGLVDDGGNTHYFQGNNFNGGIHNIRLAGLDGCWISNNELESASSDGIHVTFRSSVLGGQGPCVNVTFQANVITVPGQGRHCILLESASPVLSMGNLYTAPGTAMAGVASCFSLTSVSDYVSNPVPLTDGRAVNQLVLGSPNRATPTVTGSTEGNTALTSLLTALANTGLIINQTSTPTP